MDAERWLSRLEEARADVLHLERVIWKKERRHERTMNELESKLTKARRELRRFEKRVQNGV